MCDELRLYHADGYTALDFSLHDRHVLNANVFYAASRSCRNISRTPVQSLQRRAGDGRTIHNNNNNIWIANVQLVYVGLALQARPNYYRPHENICV